MKKIISVLLSAAIGASAIASTTSSAEEKKTATEKTGMVILGDSIASGYTVKGNVQYNYGDICGDYLGCKVSNYAVAGYDTRDVINLIDDMTAEQKKNIADAEYIVLSVGANDIIHFVSSELLKYAASKTDQKFFNDGYSAADVSEDMSFNELMAMLNIKGEGGIEDYITNGGTSAMMELNTTISKIGANLSYKTGKNIGYIANNVVPEMQQATEKLKEINPDAKIYVQNIYQPFQFEPKYIEKAYGANSGKARAINIIRYQLETVMTTFNNEIQAIDGVEIVDIKSQFTSLDKAPTVDEPGHASYFVDIQKERLADADIHPNQKGHLAIAATILEKIGKLHDDDGLLRKIYDGFSDKADYPAIALETYKKVAGKEPVVTTTTTTKKTTTTTTTSTTTTTKKPTTTTTTSTTTTTKKPTTTTTTSTTTTTKKPTTTTTTSTTTTTKKPTTTTTTSITTTTKKTTTTSTTTTSATTTSATTQPARKMGDINNDSRVDAVDASWALKEYASQSTGGSTLTAEQILVGDVDGNKKVDSVDASKILSYYAYLSNLEGEPMTITEFLGKKSK